MVTDTSFLLQAGTVLLHQGNDQVEAKRTDILIRNNIIVEIADNIPQPKDVPRSQSKMKWPNGSQSREKIHFRHRPRNTLAPQDPSATQLSA